jgi:hypothetical protein
MDDALAAKVIAEIAAVKRIPVDSITINNSIKDVRSAVAGVQRILAESGAQS